MSEQPWHIVTGEYPPRRGGVADYTAGVATGLVRAGVETHVWTPGEEGDIRESSGVFLHRWPGGFGRRELSRLGAMLDGFAGPRQLLVEYVPNVWGNRGLNLSFGRWLQGRRRAGDRIRTMVHEAFHPWLLRDRPGLWVVAAGQRRMIRDVLAASEAIDVAIPAWRAALRAHAGDRPMSWKPVPSNIPVVDDPKAVAALRRDLAPRGEVLMGCFSTYGSLMAPLLARVSSEILTQRPGRKCVLMGRGSRAFAEGMARSHPQSAGLLEPADDLDPRAASIHLQACDVLVLPYPDGVSTRRGTAMAALAHGKPVVTNRGHSSEPFWHGSGAVDAVGSVEEIAPAVESLLGDPARSARLAARARVLYDRRFAIDRTVAALLQGRPSSDGHIRT